MVDIQKDLEYEEKCMDVKAAKAARIWVVSFDDIVRSISEKPDAEEVFVTKNHVFRGTGIFVHNRKYIQKLKRFLKPEYQTEDEAYFTTGDSVAFTVDWLDNVLNHN